MATLSELYNKIATSEDFAKSSPIEKAATVTNNYNQMISPEYGKNIDQINHAITDSGNIVDSAISAGSAFVNAVGSLPVIDNVAKPLAQGIDSLHSDSYEAHQIAQQAHKDVFDKRNQAQYYSDLANGKTTTMASLAKIGREAMDYFSSANSQDIINDVGSGTGSLTGSFVLGGFIGKGIGAAYTGIKAARMATTIEGKLAGYQSALAQAQATRTQLMNKLSDMGLSNTEKEALATELGNLNKVIEEASLEQQTLIKEANLARNNLASTEYQRDVFPRAHLKNSDNPKIDAIVTELNKNVIAGEQRVTKATDALKANRASLDTNKNQANTIQDFLNQDKKIQSAEKSINKLNKFKENKLTQIKRESQEISPELGGLATNFTFGLSEGKEALAEIDNLSLEDFKANATEQAKQEFNSLVQENLAEGMSQEKAESKALDSLKFKAKASTMIKTGLAEAAISKLFGTAKLEGLGLKKGLAGGLVRTASNTLKETGEELGQTYAENSFGNKAIQYFNKDKDITENLGRDLAQTAVTIPGGMGTIKTAQAIGTLGKSGTIAITSLVKAHQAKKAEDSISNAITTGDISNASKPIKTILTHDDKSRKALKDTLDILSKQAETDKLYHNELDDIRNGIDKDDSFAKTNSRIVDRITDLVATVEAKNSSDEDKEKAIQNIYTLYNAISSIHGLIKLKGNKENGLEKLASDIASTNTKRIVDKLSDVSNKIIPELTKLIKKETSDENIIKDYADNYAQKFTFIKTLVNSNTDEDTLKDINDTLDSLNPSYAILPEVEELKAKVQLAQALKASLQEHEHLLNSTQNVMSSSARETKFDGSNMDSLRQYYQTIKDALDGDASDADLEQAYDSLKHFSSTQYIKAKYLELAINQLEKDSSLSKEDFIKKYSSENKIQLTDDKDIKLEKNTDSQAYISINKEGNFININGLSHGNNILSFNFNIRLPKFGLNGTKERVVKAGSIHQTKTLLADINAENAELFWLYHSLKNYLKPKSNAITAEMRDAHNQTSKYRQVRKEEARAAHRDARTRAIKEINKALDLERHTSLDPDNPETYTLKNNKPVTVRLLSYDKKTLVDIPLELKSNYVNKGVGVDDPNYDKQSSATVAKLLQLVKEYLATYNIEDNQERLAKQREILSKYPTRNTKHGKIPYAVSLSHLFTKESIEKAIQNLYPNNPQAQDALRNFWLNSANKGHYKLTNKGGSNTADLKNNFPVESFPLANIFMSPLVDRYYQENIDNTAPNESVQTDLFDDIPNSSDSNISEEETEDTTSKTNDESLDTLISEEEANNVSTAPIVGQDNNQKIDSISTGDDEVDDVLNSLNQNTQSTSIADTSDIEAELKNEEIQQEQNINNKEVDSLINSNPETIDDVVNHLNTLNENGYIISTPANADKIIASTSPQLNNTLDIAISNMANTIAKYVQDNFNLYKAIAPANGLLRFFKFSVQNGQVVAQFRVDPKYIKASIILGMSNSVAQASTYTDAIDNAYQAYLETLPNDKDAIPVTELTISPSNASGSEYNVASLINDFNKSKSLVINVDKLGDSISKALRVYMPSISSNRFTMQGGKNATDSLVTDILSSLTNFRPIKDTTKFVLLNGYFAIGDKRQPILNAIVLPTIFANYDNQAKITNKVNKYNKKIASLAQEVPASFIGTPEEFKALKEANAFKSKHKIKGYNAYINKDQQEANDILMAMPHKENNYGKLVVNVPMDDYIDALHPAENYISEKAKLADESTRNQIRQSYLALSADITSLSENPDNRIYYNNNYTVANRLNAEQYQSYRNSKTIREAITPEGSTTPISFKIFEDNPALANVWRRAIMQGIGDKVQNQDDKEILKNYASYVEYLRSKLGEDKFTSLAQLFDKANTEKLSPEESKQLGSLFKEIGNIIREKDGATTEVALHNTIEIIRYTANPNTEFESSVYGEADGITNGIFFSKIINSVYVAGLNNDEKLIAELANLARVGFAVGISKEEDSFYKNSLNNINPQLKDSSVQPLIKDGKTQDTYTTVAANLSKNLSDSNYTFSCPPTLNKEDKAVISSNIKLALGLLAPYFESSSYDPVTGTFNFSRNSVKKPTTQVNYSAGAKGIANDLANKIYAVFERLKGKNNNHNLMLSLSPNTPAIKEYIYNNLMAGKSDLEIKQGISIRLSGNEKKEFDLNPTCYEILKLQVAMSIIKGMVQVWDEEAESYLTVAYKPVADKGYYAGKTHMSNLGELKRNRDIAKVELHSYNYSRLSTFLKINLVEPLLYNIEETMGESNQDYHVIALYQITLLATQVHNAFLKQELSKAIGQRLSKEYKEKDIRNVLTDAYRILPYYQVRDIQKLAEQEYPTVVGMRSPNLNSDASYYNLMTYKNERLEQNIAYGKYMLPAFATEGQVVHYKSDLFVKGDPGVAPRPLGNISAGDAATMVEAIQEVSGHLGIPFQDIFDGLNISPTNYLNKNNPNRIVNQIAINKALGTNILAAYAKVYNNIVNKLDKIKEFYPKDFLDKTIKTIDPEALQDKVRQINNGHLLFKSGLVPFSCNQYAFDIHGAYTQQAKIRVFDKNLKKVVTYTVTDNIPISVLPRYMKLAYLIVDNRNRQLQEAYTQYKDNKEKLTKAIKKISNEYYQNQEQLLTMLMEAGVAYSSPDNPEVFKNRIKNIKALKPVKTGKPKKKDKLSSVNKKPKVNTNQESSEPENKTKLDLEFKSAKSLFTTDLSLVNALLDKTEDVEVAVVQSEEITKYLLENPDILPAYREQILAAAEVVNNNPNNAVTVFLDNQAIIISKNKIDSKVLNHEIIHSLFKRKLANAFKGVDLNKIQFKLLPNKQIVIEYPSDISLKQSIFLNRLQDELNNYLSANSTREYNAQVIQNYINSLSGIDLIDELTTQVIVPTALKNKSLAKTMSDLLIEALSVLMNLGITQLMNYLGLRKTATHVHGLSNLVILTSNNSINKDLPLFSSFALAPSNEDLQKVLATKPQRYKRVVKAFTYKDENRIADIYENNYTDLETVITKDQAVRWAILDDIVKNKAMSDKVLLDLNKLYSNFLKSDAFKELSLHEQRLLYGQIAQDNLGNKTVTSPLANFMWLAENSTDVQEALKKTNVPKLSFGTYNYKPDQIVADLTSNVYNKFIKTVSMSDKYDTIVAKITAGDAMTDAALNVSDNLNRLEQKGNNLVNTFMAKAITKISQNIINHTEGTPQEIAKAVGVLSTLEEEDINVVDSMSLATTLVNQRFSLPNTLSHLLEDLAGVNIDNFEPLALFKKSKAVLDRISNRLSKEVPLEIRSKFKKIDKNQERLLTSVFFRMDVSCLVDSGSQVMDIAEILSDRDSCYEQAIAIKKQANISNAQWKKIEQLAEYLASGRTGGRGLLQNAYAISKVNNQGMVDVNIQSNEEAIDKAITYLALSKVSPKDLGALSTLCTFNKEGMKDLINLHIAIKAKNLSKMPNKLNYHKGYLPRVYDNQVTVDVATSMEDVKEFQSRGWELVKTIEPNQSYIRQGDHKLYLMRCALPNVGFKQGLIKPNKLSLYGINENGFASDGIFHISAKNYDMQADTAKDFNPIPVFDQQGYIIGYDLNFDQYIEQANIATSNDSFQLLGIWNARDYIASTAKEFNKTLAKMAGEMMDRDYKVKGKEFTDKAYVSIAEVVKKDPVVCAAWNMVPYYVKQFMASNQKVKIADIKIRKDMIDLFLGYHQASITDMWTGRTRWNPKVCNVATKLAKNVLGESAYKKLAYAERAVQYTTNFARNAIVIRSVVVPFTNLTANILQLRMRGIPFSYISTAIVNKVAELEHYNQLSKNIVKLETKFATLKHPESPEGKQIRAKIDAINESIKTLSVYPMLEAGELSTINDVGDDYNNSLFTGHWAEKIDEYVGKLPEAVVQAGKYLMVSKDTGLYQMMEKATLYGDFVAKSIYYDWLIHNGTNKTYATISAMNEFVNYDMLAGRNREYLENMGILWFYNYKLRILRTSADIAIHNPISALLALHIAPDMIAKNNVFSDSILGKLLDGKLGGTFLNPSMMEAPITKNPIVELMSL